MNDKDIPVTTLAGLTSLSDCKLTLKFSYANLFTLTIYFSIERVTTFRHFAIALKHTQVAAISPASRRGSSQPARSTRRCPRPAAHQRH